VPDPSRRSFPIDATVEVDTTYAHVIVSDPKTFRNQKECRDAQEAAVLGHDPYDAPEPELADRPNETFSLSAEGRIIKGLPDELRRIAPEKADDFTNYVPISQSPLTIRPAASWKWNDCQATAQGRAQRKDPERVDVTFNIRLTACPVAEPESTGVVTFGFRVRDSRGRTDVVSGSQSKWFGRSGKEFSHSDTERLQHDIAKEILEVVDERVVDCGCVRK
jgi:hypothetical protein